MFDITQSKWYYYGAHQFEVMDAGSLDVWAQSLSRDDVSLRAK